MSSDINTRSHLSQGHKRSIVLPPSHWTSGFSLATKQPISDKASPRKYKIIHLGGAGGVQFKRMNRMGRRTKTKMSTHHSQCSSIFPELQHLHHWISSYTLNIPTILDTEPNHNTKMLNDTGTYTEIQMYRRIYRSVISVFDSIYRLVKLLNVKLPHRLQQRMFCWRRLLYHIAVLTGDYLSWEPTVSNDVGGQWEMAEMFGCVTNEPSVIYWKAKLHLLESNLQTHQQQRAVNSMWLSPWQHALGWEMCWEVLKVKSPG